MKLDQVLQPVKWQRTGGPVSVEVAGVSLDSRQVRSGFLFVALKGVTTDGRRFAKDAVERGAVAVATHEPLLGLPDSVASVCMDMTPDNLANVAHAFYGQPSCRLAAVTGTNGKTTTTYLLRHFLEQAAVRTGIVGTVVYEFGSRSIPADRTTPDVFQLYRVLHQMAESGAGAVALEVSSHALDQQRLGKLVFDVAVFTNLTQDHLDYHHTMEQYYSAKRKLFDRLRPAGKAGTPAVVSVDCPYGRRLAEELGAAGIGVATCSALGAAEAMLRAENVRVASDGCTFDMVWHGTRIPQVRLNLLGRHNVANYLGAVAAAHELGAEMQDMVAAGCALPATPGRLEFIPNNLDITVVVDYAHTDDALANVLQCLRELTRRELWVVFGCGGNRDKTKRPRMGAVAEQLANHVVLTNDNPRGEEPAAVIEDIRAGMKASPSAIMPDRREAVAFACANARPGDVVLIAGKGHETYQEVNRVYHEFDDRVVARAILAELEQQHVHA